MFLDVSDFEDVPYLIPNQEESRSLQDFIDAKEAEYLKKVLGLSFYNEFIAGLDSSGTVEQIWVDLRDGKEYTVSNQAYEWKGVREMLKPVIYSQWLEHNYRKWSNGGMIVNNGQNNSTSVNPIDEIVENWNKFVKIVGLGYHYWYICYGNTEGTLRGFLNENSTDYEGWNNAQTYNLQLRNTLDL